MLLLSSLLFCGSRRQHWGYIGGGIDGGSWVYDRVNGEGERLDYREWRAVLGWESAPPRPPGVFRTTGYQFNVEVGYVCGREFEFESGSPDISIGNTLLVRTKISF